MPHKDETYDEMELADILRELYRSKWILLGLTIVAGLLVAGYTLTIPNTYESSAALIVREPQGVIVRDIEGPIAEQAQGMDVETMQTLAESTEIQWKLFQRLWDNEAIDKWQEPGIDPLRTFQRFQQALETDIRRRQQGRGATEALPILILTARAQSPEEAQIIANEWAQLLEGRSTEIYAEGIEALDEFIGNMYGRSNEALRDFETELVAKKMEARLDLQKARLETVQERIKGLEEDIVEIGVDVSVNEVTIREGRRRVGQQQHDGQWIGDVVEEMIVTNREYPFDIDALAAQGREVVQWVERKVRQAESLRDYRRENNLLSKQKRLAHLELDIERILAEKAEKTDELPSKQAQLASLNEQIATIPEKLVLDKAITDDALWNAYISDELSDDAFTPLKTEIINPTFQSTEKIIIETAAEVEALTNSIDQLTRSADTASQELSRLESEIDAIKREIERREAQLESTQQVLTMFREDFEEELTLVEQLTIENERLKDELQIKRQLRDDLSEEASELDESILTSTQEIDVLEREVDNTLSIQNQLASKAEEVALLQISSEQAARTGTAILFGAEINPQRVAPARSRIVLGSMVAAFAILCFVLIGAKLVKETGNDTAPEPQTPGTQET